MIRGARRRHSDGDAWRGNRRLSSGTIPRRSRRLTLMPRSFAISIAETPDGVVWLGTRDIGLLRVEESHVKRITEGLPDPKINCLLTDDNGDLWIGTDRGVARWHDGRVTRSRYSGRSGQCADSGDGSRSRVQHLGCRGCAWPASCQRARCLGTPRSGVRAARKCDVAVRRS